MSGGAVYFLPRGLRADVDGKTVTIRMRSAVAAKRVFNVICDLSLARTAIVSAHEGAQPPAPAAWVSVKDRLPDPGVACIVQIRWRPAVRMCLAFWSDEEQAWVRQLPDRFAGDLTDGEVTHWMPRPTAAPYGD